MEEIVIKIENLKKKYRLGVIGGTTLQAELSSWWAKVRKKEDPNSIIGTDPGRVGEQFWALNGINLEVSRGEALGIIGLNGAGKSTLLKILSRVTAPTEGKIKIKGRISSMLEVGTGFHEELTGRENIYLNGAILGMNKLEVDKKIDSIIDFSECRRFIDTPVKRYSSGMYVKLAFAVAAFLDSEIMIMDEVLAVGDMNFQKKCLRKMGDSAQYEGKTILYVSHNMSTIQQLCTRCIVLEKGMVIYDGDVKGAIKIYLGKHLTDYKVYYDLENSKRFYLEDRQEIKILKLEILNKKEAVYLENEKMQVCFHWEGKKEIKDVQVMITISSMEGLIIPVGTAISPAVISSEGNGKGSTELEIDLSCLTAGKYFYHISLFKSNKMGMYYKIDMPDDRVSFEIVESTLKKNLQWQDTYWGNIYLPDINVIRTD